MTADASNLEENAYLQITQLIQQADEAVKNYQLEEAIAPVQTVLELYRENSNTTGQVYALNKLAQLHQQISKTQYDQAIELLMRKSQVIETGDPGPRGIPGDPPPLKSVPVSTQDPGNGISGTPPPPPPKP